MEFNMDLFARCVLQSIATYLTCQFSVKSLSITNKLYNSGHNPDENWHINQYASVSYVW